MSDHRVSPSIQPDNEITLPGRGRTQAVSALMHLADAVLFVLDASGECGYPLDDQLELLADVESTFEAPVLVVCNKADRSTEADADHYMSVETGAGVEAVLDAAIEAVGHEPELPFEG